MPNSVCSLQRKQCKLGLSSLECPAGWNASVASADDVGCRREHVTIVQLLDQGVPFPILTLIPAFLRTFISSSALFVVEQLSLSAAR